MRRPANLLVALLLTPALHLAGCSGGMLPTDVAPEPALAATTAACVGDVLLGTQAQVNAFDCSEVTGNLTIAHNVNGANTDINDLRPLATLTSVGGTLLIFRNPMLASLAGLDNLGSVGGAIEIVENNTLSSIAALARITSVGGRLYIRGNAALASLAGLGNLTSVVENVVLESLGVTSLAGLESLTAAGTTFTIQFNHSLVSLAGLSSLSSFPGWLTIRDNDALTSLAGLEDLTAIETLYVQENDALASLNGLQNLQDIENLVIDANTALPSLAGLENVSSVGGVFTISGNPALTSLSGLAGLTSVDRLSITGNNALASLSELRNLAAVGSLTVSGTAARSLAGMEKISSTAGSLSISSNGQLASLAELNRLTSVGGNLSIWDNPVLPSLAGLDKVTSVGGFLTVVRNAILPSLNGLEGLTSVGSWLDIDRNAALTALAGLEQLTTVGGQLFIRENVTLTSLSGLSRLASVGGGMYIRDNPVLPSLVGLNSLAGVGSELIIERNVALTSLTGLSSLVDIGTPGHQFTIQDNPALTSLAGLESLTTLASQLNIEENAALTSLAGLDRLVSVGRGIDIERNDALTSLSALANLTSVAGTFTIRANGSLTSLAGLQNLTTIGGNLIISGNPVLSTCGCGLIGLISGGSFTGVGEEVDITNNAPSGQCNSPSVVLASPCAANRPPVANAGPDQSVECAGLAGASVTLNGVGSFDEDGDALSLSWTMGGSVIASGATPTLMLAYGSRTVALTLVGANPLVVSSGESYVEHGATATDGCQGDLTGAITIDASAVNTNTPGTYSVLYTVQDGNGQSASATRTVQVLGAATVPVITVGRAAQTLWPPNGKQQNFALGQLNLSVSDPSDPSLSAARVVIAAVWSDEPEVGAGDSTRGDIAIAPACGSVKLRVERRQTGNGRVYTLLLVVTNASGLTGTATYQVFVPVTKKGQAVDDGAAAGHMV